MSIVSDHLTDDSSRGMYGPTPESKVNEAMRLANLLAIARVRRYAYNAGKAPNETLTGINKRISTAENNFKKHLESVL